MSINISSQVYSIPYLYTMSQAEYRKLQKRSDGETLLVTIPTGFAYGKWQPINYFDGTPQHHVHRQEVYEGN